MSTETNFLSPERPKNSTLKISRRNHPEISLENSPRIISAEGSSFREKKEPKPKVFDLDIFGWVGVLPREGVGAKKFGMSFEPNFGTKLFWWDIPAFCRDITGPPEKFEKKR